MASDLPALAGHNIVQEYVRPAPTPSGTGYATTLTIMTHGKRKSWDMPQCRGVAWLVRLTPCNAKPANLAWHLRLRYIWPTSSSSTEATAGLSAVSTKAVGWSGPNAHESCAEQGSTLYNIRIKRILCSVTICVFHFASSCFSALQGSSRSLHRQNQRRCSWNIEAIFEHGSFRRCAPVHAQEDEEKEKKSHVKVTALSLIRPHA